MAETPLYLNGISTKQKYVWLLITLVFLITFLIYLPNIPDTLLNMDLPAYNQVLYSNDYTKTTLRLFSDFSGQIVPGYYSPLSSVSLMLDKLAVGSQTPVPRATFLVNIILHCLNGLLLFLFMRAFRAPNWAVITAVFVFLVHPVEIASILWFAERKTLLATLFYLIAFLIYVIFRQTSSYKWYGIALCAFVLGLLSKPTVIVLPIVLLGTEFVRAGFSSEKPNDISRSDQSQVSSLDHVDNFKSVPPTCSSTSLAVRLWPLVPFFLLAAGMSLLTIKTEGHGNAVLPVIERPFIAASALWFYIIKLLVPFNVTPLPSKWTLDLGNLFWWLLLFLCIAILILLYRFRKRIDSLFLMGLINFAVPLLPVIGVTRFGWLQLSYVGYHLAYLSMVGASICIGFLFTASMRLKQPLVRYLCIGVISCYLASLPILTFYQSRLWSNPIALWNHTVLLNQHSQTARSMLAYAFSNAGHPDHAEGHFKEALHMTPDSDIARIYEALGVVQLKQNKLSDAIESLRKALRLNPRLSYAYSNLGEAELRKGRINEAEKLFKTAIRLQPFNSTAYNNLGNLRLSQGKTNEAIKLFRKAIYFKRDAAEAYNNLGVALMNQGKTREAHEYFERAISFRPDYAEGQANLGMTNIRLGFISQGIEHLYKALRLNGNLTAARLHLGKALEIENRRHEAADQYAAVIKIDPASLPAHFRLAQVLVRLGKTRSAIPHYEKVLESNPRDFKLHTHLGNMFMSISEWEKAAKHFRHAISIQPDHEEALVNLKEALRRSADSSTSLDK